MKTSDEVVGVFVCQIFGVATTQAGNMKLVLMGHDTDASEAMAALSIRHSKRMVKVTVELPEFDEDSIDWDELDVEF